MVQHSFLTPSFHNLHWAACLLTSTPKLQQTGDFLSQFCLRWPSLGCSYFLQISATAAHASGRPASQRGLGDICIWVKGADGLGLTAEGFLGWKLKWQQEVECDLISSLVSEADLLSGKLALLGV